MLRLESLYWLIKYNSHRPRVPIGDFYLNARVQIINFFNLSSVFPLIKEYNYTGISALPFGMCVGGGFQDSSREIEKLWANKETKVAYEEKCVLWIF